MQSKRDLSAALIIPALFLFSAISNPPLAAAATNRFAVEISNLKLMTNNGRALPYESQALPPSDNPVQVIVQGRIKVLGGQLANLFVLDGGSGAAVWSQRGGAQIPAQGMDWSGSVTVKPGETVRLSIMATGYDSVNNRAERRYTFAESVILLSGTLPPHGAPAAFEVEFKDVKLGLNGGVSPAFQSRTLTDNDLFSPWNRQVAVTGMVVVKKGELLWLEAVGNDQSTTILQKTLAPRPMTTGTENFFSTHLTLDPDQPLAISLKAIGLNARGDDQGPAVFYPSKPVVLTYKPPRQIQVSPFKFTVSSRRLLVDSTATGGKTMEWTDIPKDGYIYETAKNSIFNVFSVIWKLEGGKVTKVEYTKDGNHWSEEKSLQIDPATGAVIGVSANWNAKPGENFDIRIRVTGVDVDQDGNAVSGPKTVLDNLSAKLSVKTLPPFTAAFTRLYIEAAEVKSDFKSLPAQGIKMISAEALPVMLTAEWAVTIGKLTKVLYSIDGGQNWNEAEKRTGPAATQVAVSAAPGQSLDIVFKLQGQNAGEAAGEILDSAHARLSIEKPKEIPLDAGFINQVFYEEGTGAPLKYFSELAGNVFDYPVTQAPARLEAQVTWWKKTGVLESVGVSFDGGNRWQTTLINPAENFWKISVPLSPGETRDIVFQLQGYDQNVEGRRVGPLKTITDSLHGKISGKAAGVPFQASFKNQTVILSGKATKFSDFPEGGLSYVVDPKNPKIAIKTSFEFKGYLTILAISKDGGKTEWDSVVFQPGQATGEHTFELPAASGENLDLVFRIEGFDVDSWGRPKGQHQLITDTQHGTLKVQPPPVATFHDQGLGIGNDSIMFSKIPPEGLRLSSALPVPIYAWSELAVKGSRVKKGFFSTDGGENWQTFQSVSNSSISGDIGKAKPGQKWNIVFKIEQAPLDANGKESGPPIELMDENHALVEIVPPGGFEAPVDFSQQQIQIGDKIFPFEKIDPGEGLVFESSEAVRLDMSASISIPAKNVIAKNGAIFNGQDTVAFNSLNNKQKDRIMGYLYPAPGQTLDLAFVCEVQGLDAAGHPIPGAVKAVRDAVHRKITIHKPAAHPFKAEFTEKTGKIGSETKNFSDIPAAGWNYETPEANGTIAYTVSWKLDSGYLKSVLCSTDGGATWLTRTIRDDENPDTHTFETRFESADAPGNAHTVVCALEGVDVDESGNEISEPRRIQDAQPAKILFIKSAKPHVELSDIQINGEPLEDIPPVIPLESIEDGIVRVTGRLQANVPVEHLMLSTDGGMKWQELEPAPQWDYEFKPEPEETYELVLKAVLKDGTTVDVTGYPKNHFRFSGSRAEVEDPQDVLQEMVRAYENKDTPGLMARVAEDFPNREEMEEFIRRDFRDFDGIKLNLFFKNTVETSDGQSIEADWEIRYSPANVGTQVVARGQALSFIFKSEEGRLKLFKMRGANPLFGARSPDVAASSGVPGAVADTLRKIEDEGSRESKTTALNVVASELDTSTKFIPLTFEIVDVFAHYTDGAQEEVNFDAMQTGRPIAGEARIRITDNPKNIDVTGILLEITDSISGDRLTFTGDVQANQEVVFRTTDLIIFDPADAGQSGRLTFVLDPADVFIAIDREVKTVRQDYTLV